MTSRGSDYHFVGWWSVTTSISPHEKAGFSAITVFGYGLTNCPEPWKITLRWYLVHYNVMPKGLSISIWVGNETRYVGGFLKAVNQLLLLFVDQKNWKNVILLGRLFLFIFKIFFGDVFSLWWSLRSITPRPKAQKVTVVCLLCCFMFRKFHRSSFCQVFQCLKRCRECVFVCLCRPPGRDKSLLELAPDISR